MTRKTRQEKIIAELRRKLESTTTISQFPPQVSELPKVSKPPATPLRQDFMGQTTHNSPHFVRQLTDFEGQATYNPIYIKRDLTKTLILTILAISFELVIYWLWNK